MLKKTNFLTVLAQAVEDEHVGIPIRDIFDVVRRAIARGNEAAASFHIIGEIFFEVVDLLDDALLHPARIEGVVFDLNDRKVWIKVDWFKTIHGNHLLPRGDYSTEKHGHLQGECVRKEEGTS